MTSLLYCLGAWVSWARARFPQAQEVLTKWTGMVRGFSQVPSSKQLTSLLYCLGACVKLGARLLPPGAGDTYAVDWDGTTFPL